MHPIRKKRLTIVLFLMVGLAVAVVQCSEPVQDAVWEWVAGWLCRGPVG